MYTIDNNENIITIKKSKFITNIFYIESINDIEKIKHMIKNKYKDASHYCYAYIIDNIKKYDDNGEPSGTAGKPILDILEIKHLNNVLCIVTRYFGGIKLGSSNLLRAYSNSTKEILKKCNQYELVDGYSVKITFNYEDLKIIDNLVKEEDIKEKIYEEKVTYIINVSNDIIEKIKKLNIKVNIINKVKIKRLI